MLLHRSWVIDMEHCPRRLSQGRGWVIPAFLGLVWPLEGQTSQCSEVCFVVHVWKVLEYSADLSGFAYGGVHAHTR